VQSCRNKRTSLGSESRPDARFGPAEDSLTLTRASGSGCPHTARASRLCSPSCVRCAAPAGAEFRPSVAVRALAPRATSRRPPRGTLPRAAPLMQSHTHAWPDARPNQCHAVGTQSSRMPPEFIVTRAAEPPLPAGRMPGAAAPLARAASPALGPGRRNLQRRAAAAPTARRRRRAWAAPPRAPSRRTRRRRRRRRRESTPSPRAPC